MADWGVSFTSRARKEEQNASLQRSEAQRFVLLSKVT